VWFTPVLMKKGRPAFQLTALCPASAAAEVTRQIFLNSTTLGVRRHSAQRAILPRRMLQLATPYGQVAAKAARHGQRVSVQPEYEDCRRLAAERGVPYLEVHRAAMAAAEAARADAWPDP
jgi:uncharacterized protein (DUF111 family)